MEGAHAVFCCVSDLNIELLLFGILGCPEVSGNRQVPPGDHVEHVVRC